MIEEWNNIFKVQRGDNVEHRQLKLKKRRKKRNKVLTVIWGQNDGTFIETGNQRECDLQSLFGKIIRKYSPAKEKNDQSHIKLSIDHLFKCTIRMENSFKVHSFSKWCELEVCRTFYYLGLYISGSINCFINKFKLNFPLSRSHSLS